MSTQIYAVKCDECKVTIRETSNIRESYMGDRCEKCWLELGLKAIIAFRNSDQPAQAVACMVAVAESTLKHVANIH